MDVETSAKWGRNFKNTRQYEVYLALQRKEIGHLLSIDHVSRRQGFVRKIIGLCKSKNTFVTKERYALQYQCVQSFNKAI